MKHVNGLDIPASFEELCDQRRLALLVYDMQVGIVSQIANGAQIVERVGQALEAARSAGVRVAFTRHMSLPKAWMGVTQYRTAMAWQRVENPDDVQPWFLPDAPAFAMVPELSPRADEFVFDKLTMSAFASTPLALALHDAGVLAIALAGIAMEIGIEPTAREAPDHGIIPIVIADACGCGNRAAAERSLETLKFIGETVICDTVGFATTLRRAGGIA